MADKRSDGKIADVFNEKDECIGYAKKASRSHGGIPFFDDIGEMIGFVFGSLLLSVIGSLLIGCNSMLAKVLGYILVSFSLPGLLVGAVIFGIPFAIIWLIVKAAG